LDNTSNEIIILGGGMAGLSAGHVLTNAGCRVRVFERDHTVGGLSKTIVKDGFRFDLGGHRFFTTDAATDAFVRGLMADELVTVSRSSKIFMHGKYFDYPLRPLNAIFGMGIQATAKIMADYGLESVKRFVKQRQIVSLEDWVVNNFGRTLFSLYFQQYSEKIWGIDCSRISAEWVAERIKGLSLAKAIKNAFFKLNGKDLPTLADRFLYPRLGIGRIAERIREEIERRNQVVTGANVVRINHSGHTIENIVVENEQGRQIVGGEEFVSSIPVTQLIRSLHPAPPQAVLDAASTLRFRDLVIVAIMLDRERVTDQTWIYIPEQQIPFGRIHEPTNWSRTMAPAGKTLLVTEFFSFRGDAVWKERDERLTSVAVDNLGRLGLIEKHDILDSVVVRVPNAYPLFEIGYRERCGVLLDYLDRLNNLHVTGRSGMFRYYNMDAAIKSGVEAAAGILRGRRSVSGEELGHPVFTNT
jgi:protoporphyrinogen oxidase